MQKYTGFIPRETWGSNLIGAKNRYLREEWDERHCNQIIGSRTGKNCIGIRLENITLKLFKIIFLPLVPRLKI